MVTILQTGFFGNFCLGVKVMLLYFDPQVVRVQAGTRSVALVRQGCSQNQKRMECLKSLVLSFSKTIKHPSPCFKIIIHL